MKSIVLAVSFLTLSLTACKRSGPARAEALKRVSELSSAATRFNLMVKTGWQEPDPLKTAEYQDTLARLERARADARESEATAKDIKQAETKGAEGAAADHEKFVAVAGESPRDLDERIKRIRADLKAANDLEAAKAETRSVIRDGEDAEKIRAWQRSRR